MNNVIVHDEETQRFEPGAAGCEALTLPLCCTFFLSFSVMPLPAIRLTRGPEALPFPSRPPTSTPASPWPPGSRGASPLTLQPRPRCSRPCSTLRLSPLPRCPRLPLHPSCRPTSTGSITPRSRTLPPSVRQYHTTNMVSFDWSWLLGALAQLIHSLGPG